MKILRRLLPGMFDDSDLDMLLLHDVCNVWVE